MKKVNLFLFFLCTCTNLLAQNPIAAFYNGAQGYPAWTDEVKWENKITMENKNSGLLNFEEFKAKRDILYAQGGGVLYYPAGTYLFNISDGPNDEGLMLKKGVVILGEAPTTDNVAVTGRTTTPGSVNIDQHGLGSMPTKFIFSRRSSEYSPTDSIPKMWNCIGQKKGTNETKLSQNTLMGVAWIEMEFGYIYFGMDAVEGWAPTYAVSNGYTGGADKQLNGWNARVPDGTHFMDPFCGIYDWQKTTAIVPSKIFVFGVKMTNCTPPNYVCDRLKKYSSGWRHENSGWRFGARIGIDAKNVFVANNVIDKPTKVFSYSSPTASSGTKTLMFDYGNAIGIDVNKSLLSGFKNRALITQQEGFYEPNVIIWDNWIYNHGNKGIELAGTWAVVKGNVNYRHHLGSSIAYSYLTGFDQLFYCLDGWSYSTSESASDLMARFADYGGHNVWFDDNRWCGTGSKGNDGEGILLQRSNGMEVYSVAITNNKQANLNSGESGYIGPWDAYAIGLFQGWNTLVGQVGAYICGAQANYAQDISNVENYQLNGTTPSVVACGPSSVNTAVTNAPQDWQSGCPTLDPTAPVISLLTYNSTTGAVEIAWNDVDNEVAYRVDRRKVGTTEWYTVVYRPRSQTKTTTQTLPLPGFGYTNVDPLSGPILIKDMNKTEWHDYTTVKGTYEYRVAAIKCTATDATFASSPQQILTSYIYSPTAYVIPVTVQPNPIQNSALVKFNLEEGTTATISLLSLNGKVVRELGKKLVGSATIDAAGLTSGSYLLRITDSKGRRSVAKVVVQ